MTDAEIRDFQKWLKKQVGRKLTPAEFEEHFPDGDSGAIRCRWCGAFKKRLDYRPTKNRHLKHLVLYCPTCDPNFKKD